MTEHDPAADYVAEYAARKYDPRTYVERIEAETDALAALLGSGWERASRAGLRSTYGNAFINMIAGEIVYRIDGRVTRVDVRDMSVADIAAVVKAAKL